MKNIIYLACALVLLHGCKPQPLTSDIPQAPEKLVIASQVLPEGTLLVALTHSFSALSDKRPRLVDSVTVRIPEELLVRDAKVSLITPAGELPLQMLYPGFYSVEGLSLSPRRSYTIKAVDPQTGERATATTELLSQVTFDSVRALPCGGKSFKLSYSFTDEPGAQNWYVVNYYTQNSAGSKGGTGSGNPLDIDNIAKRMLEQRLDFELISEAELTGGRYCGSRTFTTPGGLDTVAVALSSITKGYYDFLKTYQRSFTLFNQLRGEVVNLPGNVQDGYGYYNMHVPDVQWIAIGRQ